MKQKWKGSALMAPLPAVLVCCGTGDKKNVLTIAWTGIVSSRPPKTYISVRPERYSHKLIEESGVFSINLPTEEIAKQLDLCGVKSGRDADKFALCGFDTEDCFEIDCVSIAQCPVTLECRVTDKIPLGSHDMFIADIVGVNVDERFVVNGKLRLDKCKPVAYSHGEYYGLGKRLGGFGYSVIKQSTVKRRARQKREKGKVNFEQKNLTQ